MGKIHSGTRMKENKERRAIDGNINSGQKNKIYCLKK
jgi:hypothetical protein